MHEHLLLERVLRHMLEDPEVIAGQPLDAATLAALQSKRALPGAFVVFMKTLGDGAELPALRVRSVVDEAVDAFWKHTAPATLDRARYLLLGDDYGGEYYALDLATEVPHPVVYLESARLSDGDAPTVVAPSLLAFLRSPID